ncbi:type II toxin-antitoxin system VapC family toxin [Deinococcus detaillensis]|uniref:type II toxin-antitoxin system VapC family toxin n=1 Tax=Deinococcus detaillensis TaxID=2592048 RepID=UPI001CDD74E4|nr:type II toxin-antitoxin system VapC family toxin [Deinococcus detaillensis]
MNGILLDTNVISELRKVNAGRADPQVAQWAAGVQTSQLYLSVITVQELEMGILLRERRDTQQGAALRLWFERQVLPTFAGRILPVTLAVARQCAALNLPDPKPERDGLIAATALVHNLMMATRNTKDFQGTGVQLLNPWQSDTIH